MLGKLIKYDLKALAKILAPLWGVLLVMGIIFGISIRSNLEGIGNTMIVFSLVVIVAVIVAIFVVNVIIVIQRFWKGLLQEEGYLMFTLPVTTRSLILSKVISALIITWGTAFVISLLGVEIISDQSSKTYGYRNVFWKLGHQSTRRTMDRIWSNHSGGKSAKQYLSCIRSNGDRTAEQRQSIPVYICGICSIINHCITYWNSNNGKFRKYGFKPAERIWI